jgi:hypothetical protein
VTGVWLDEPASVALYRRCPQMTARLRIDAVLRCSGALAPDEPMLSKLVLGAASRPRSRGSHEQADDRARQDELIVRREATGAMPAAPAVKELAAVRTQPRKNVLEIGRGSRCGPKRGRIERPMAEREQRQTEEAAANLEATIGDVLVRHPITGQMQRRTEGEGGEPRACQRTQRSTRRDMERDDHEW